MIVRGLKVENLRGIREANLDDLGKINILVGRNASGKSTILEALYIALAPGRGLSYVIRRRGWFGLASAETLFYNLGGEARVEVLFRDGSMEEVTMKRGTPVADDIPVLERLGLNVNRLYTIHVTTRGRIVGEYRFYVDSDGKTRYEPTIEKGESFNVIFIDWNNVYTYGTPEDVYSEMLKRGGLDAKNVLVETLRLEFEELRDIVTIRAHDNWVLHVVLGDRAIPYYVVGDGIRYALMYLMVTLTPKGALLLLEEPELHAHPSLMRVIASSIVKSSLERGNQVLLSTHSLELVEFMLEEARKLGLGDEDLKVYKLKLADGKLYSKTYTLSRAHEVAIELGWDIRR